ncbi:MAG: hypothetical protein AB7O68_16980 [Pirellulales bacterium]
MSDKDTKATAPKSACCGAKAIYRNNSVNGMASCGYQCSVCGLEYKVTFVQGDPAQTAEARLPTDNNQPHVKILNKVTPEMCGTEHVASPTMTPAEEKETKKRLYDFMETECTYNGDARQHQDAHPHQEYFFCERCLSDRLETLLKERDLYKTRYEVSSEQATGFMEEAKLYRHDAEVAEKALTFYGNKKHFTYDEVGAEYEDIEIELLDDGSVARAALSALKGKYSPTDLCRY